MPQVFVREVHRVLRPSGSFFFRTPNKYHYVSLIARTTPHWFHRLAANRVRGLSKDAHEPCQTFYRVNKSKIIERIARETDFKRIELRLFEGEPSYLVFHTIPFLIGVVYERLVNRFELFGGLRANIFGRMVK